MWKVCVTVTSRKFSTFLYCAKKLVTFYKVFVFINLLSWYAWGKSQWHRNPGDWPEIRYHNISKGRLCRNLRHSTRLRQPGLPFFVQSKVAACFEIFPVLLQNKIEKISIALETIHHHARFINTRSRWKYLCPRSSKYSNSRQNEAKDVGQVLLVNRTTYSLF